MGEPCPSTGRERRPMEEQAPSAPAEGWQLHARLTAIVEPMLATIRDAGCRDRARALITLLVRDHGHPAIILSPSGPRWHPLCRRALHKHHPDILPSTNMAEGAVKALLRIGVVVDDPETHQRARRQADGTIKAPPVMYRLAGAFVEALIAYTEEVLLRSFESAVKKNFSSRSSFRKKEKVSTAESRQGGAGDDGKPAVYTTGKDADIRKRALARSKHLYHPGAPRPHETPASTLARLKGEMMHRVYLARDAARKALEPMPTKVPQAVPAAPFTGGPIPLDALAPIPDRPAEDEPECLGRLGRKLQSWRVL